MLSAPPAYVLTYATSDRNTCLAPIVCVSSTDNISNLYSHGIIVINTNLHSIPISIAVASHHG